MDSLLNKDHLLKAKLIVTCRILCHRFRQAKIKLFGKSDVKVLHDNCWVVVLFVSDTREPVFLKVRKKNEHNVYPMFHLKLAVLNLVFLLIFDVFGSLMLCVYLVEFYKKMNLKSVESTFLK